MNRSQTTSQNKPNSKSQTKVVTKKTPVGLHKSNKHRGRYNFDALVTSLPELKKHIIKNPKGEKSINFSDPESVKMLNKALLAHHYMIKEWDIPRGYLCPPIPGRADYVHRVASLLENESSKLAHKKVNALDIGVGANCIYPIVGAVDYGWNYIGSDIDPISVKTANTIAKGNPVLKNKIECRLQSESRYLFKNIIKPGEYYHITTCNPPFHKSLQEAQQGTDRKLKNLNANKKKKGQSAVQDMKGKQAKLNFGGQKAELWCPGGEAAFIKNMAFESKVFAEQVLWFSTLVSKKENVRWMRKNLEKAGATEVHIEEMSQGQKKSRFIAWTFKDSAQRKKWLEQKNCLSQ
ncbi:23S rRNA (adenine(1618)-N(6))-methyltransferase RlmF [Vibrio hannami]|uniref:23S rRNA (adenine(1618)-N(6))-methyltransferase RlmF n=1 Tax=Vibrio hannami TaxID=2717094 RepID=UPI00240EABDC|nr:23S rRNA (adenine(1618)-N(6))-methyltransferase RlmF [Vibrio hannami]MDG3084974.1 23S rRNA (adenine(1618)-N(6))-methyltransferase RlmF [Vibrio hannami]